MEQLEQLLERLLALDGKLLLWIRETAAHPVLDVGMKTISRMGDKGICWIVLGLLFLLWGLKEKRWLRRGEMVLASLLADGVLCNLLLKPLVNRTRPYLVFGYDLLVPPLHDPSFPSGHTAASFAAATAVYAFSPKWGNVLYVFGVWMGFSRIYLGVHYPTDVLAGAVVGVVSAKIALYLLALFWKSEGKI